jgi:hypothetical protein
MESSRIGAARIQSQLQHACCGQFPAIRAKRVCAFFDAALFEPLEASIHVLPCFFVLVLSDSGTRTRCGIFEYEYEYEYEYHFIEYEYDKSQYSAVSKPAPTSRTRWNAPYSAELLAASDRGLAVS